MLEVIYPQHINDQWESIEVAKATTAKTTKTIKTTKRRRRAQQQADSKPSTFPTPRASQGTRRDITLRKQSTGKIFTTRALLKNNNPQHAYIEDTKRKRIRTNMGYVMFCFQVPRAQGQQGQGQEKENIIFDIPQHKTLPTVAVKMCSWQSITDFKEAGKAEDPLKEAGAMQFIGDNQHVMGCNDLLSDDKYLYMVMPFMPHGDLLGMIYNGRRGGLAQPVARFIFRQLLSTLQYMKEWGVVHRDISSENIMMDDQGRCVLIDLGMAIRVPDQAMQEGQTEAMMSPQGACGKLPYMAPEIFANSKDFDGYAVDLWSAGVVLYSMLTGENECAVRDGCRILYNKPSSRHDPIFELLTRPDKRGLEILLDCWDMTMDGDAIDLLQSIFQLDPLERPSLEEVMNHSWVTNPDVITQEEMMEYLELYQCDGM